MHTVKYHDPNIGGTLDTCYYATKKDADKYAQSITAEDCGITRVWVDGVNINPQPDDAVIIISDFADEDPGHWEQLSTRAVAEKTAGCEIVSEDPDDIERFRHYYGE